MKIGVKLFITPVNPEDKPVSAYVNKNAGKKFPKYPTQAKKNQSFFCFIFFSDIIEIGNKNVLASKIRIAATWDELNNSVPSKACIPRFIRMKELPQINPRSKR